MKLSDLKANPENPRKISKQQLTALKKSLDRFGDLSGIVFNRKTKRLVGGHQRISVIPPASKIEVERKFKKPNKTGTVAEGFIIVGDERHKYREVEWDSLTEKAANIAANKHGGEFDNEKLTKWLKELKEEKVDFDLVGFSIEELTELKIETADAGLTDEDAVPPVPERTEVKNGDLFILGDHRLLCGDSTKIEDVERLMGGDKADMVFTDPPYGVNYGSMDRHKKIYGRTGENHIENDQFSTHEMAENIWKPSFCNAANTSKDDASIYITAPQGGDQMMMMMMMNIYWQVKHELIWMKPSPAFSMGRLNYDYQHEPIIFGWKKKHNFFGKGQHIKSVWQIDRDSDQSHPTMKPVALVENALLNSSESGQLCLDIFLGSGSTLIACEKTKRKCYGLEIDPHYCSVILDRWERFSGKQAKHENGRLWSEIKATQTKPKRKSK